MSSVYDVFKRHPLFCFFVLVYPLSWYSWLLSLAGVKTSGGLNPLGPLVAALIVTGMSVGRSGIKALLRRLILWRVSVAWYAVVLMLPVLICALVTLLNVHLFGAPAPELNLGSSWKNLVEQFIFILLFIGLGEEPGWRGFALPHLQASRSPFKASLILVVFWAIWHIPLFGSEFKKEQILPFLISIVAATIIITWIFNHTRGSILLCMMFHAAVNTVGAGYIFPMFSEAYLNSLWWINATLWALAAILVLITPGSGMFKRGLTVEDLKVS